MEGQRVHAVSRDGERLAVDLTDMSLTIDGAPRPHPPAMLHDCPYLRSEYGSGQITISATEGAVTFEAGAMSGDEEGAGRSSG